MRASVASWFHRLLILWTFLILSPSSGGLVGHPALSSSVCIRHVVASFVVHGTHLFHQVDDHKTTDKFGPYKI